MSARRKESREQTARCSKVEVNPQRQDGLMDWVQETRRRREGDEKRERGRERKGMF